jgi:hypothetical protein
MAIATDCNPNDFPKDSALAEFPEGGTCSVIAKKARLPTWDSNIATPCSSPFLFEDLTNTAEDAIIRATTGRPASVPLAQSKFLTSAFWQIANDAVFFCRSL